MAVLRKKVNRADYYVRDSFKQQHLLVRVTYQVTSAGIDCLLGRGIKDGDNIPKDLFDALLRDGDLYTGKSGASETIDLESPSKGKTPGLWSVANPSLAGSHRSPLPRTFTDDLRDYSGGLIRFRDFRDRYMHHEIKAIRKAYDAIRKDFYTHLQRKLRALLADRSFYRVDEIGNSIVIHCYPRTRPEIQRRRKRRPAGDHNRFHEKE